MAWQINLETMTLAEMEMLAEHLALKTMADLQKWATEVKTTNEIPIKTIRFVTWMAKHSENPDFTMEEAGKLTMPEMQALFASPNADGGEAASSSNGKGPSSSSTRGQSRRSRSGV